MKCACRLSPNAPQVCVWSRTYSMSSVGWRVNRDPLPSSPPSNGLQQAFYCRKDKTIPRNCAVSQWGHRPSLIACCLFAKLFLYARLHFLICFITHNCHVTEQNHFCPQIQQKQILSPRDSLVAVLAVQLWADTQLTKGRYPADKGQIPSWQVSNVSVGYSMTWVIFRGQSLLLAFWNCWICLERIYT